MKFKIIPIAGDASFRKFYRININGKSKILVNAQREKYKNLVAYVAVNKFLIKNKILAPKLFESNYTNGTIIIEDFGDLSFHQLLLKQKKKLPIYKKLVDLLIKIQRIKPKLKIKSIIHKPHLIKKYSKKYLHQETDLFFKWYLPLIVRKKKHKLIKKNVRKILSQLYKKLNFPNSYFVHRDYHVKNLMKVGKKIGIIDSQDALIGNPAYDLVSLIDDVRIKTSKSLKNKIYNYYVKNNSFISKSNSNLFLQDFNILSVQRNLKIIGIFSRLFKRDNKKIYLKLIPYTWRLLEARMHSEIFSDLKKIFEININKSIRKKFLN